jgi:hypothetical protein
MWLNQVQCFYQQLCLADREVLLNRQLRVDAKHEASSVWEPSPNMKPLDYKLFFCYFSRVKMKNMKDKGGVGQTA